MKQFLFVSSFLFLTFHLNAQVGIGTTSPDISSMLDITSSNSGLLIPRVALVSSSDVATIASPITSLLVYNSGFTPNGYYYWNGVVWIQLATGSVSAWNILGNTNIVDGTNFIGTGAATNVDVAFRRNNAAAGKIGATSTSFGVGALNAGALTNNTAFGTNALILSTGTNNVAIGNGTLASNTTGIQNTGVGNAALAVNTGSASTAIGFEAMKANTSGSNGTAVGFQALFKNIGASNNTAVGFQTMLNNTTGIENTALGFQSSSIGASASKNTSVGYISLNNNIGSENTAIGHSSMSGINNAASRYNTAIGYQSMFAGTGIVSNVVAVGANALFQNTASNTVGIGYNALQGQIGGGTSNTGVGYSVLNNNSTGDNNTAVGSEAGFAAVGSGNTLIGYRAGQFASNAAGAGTFVGYLAGQNTTGANNTVIGNNALVATGASANSVAIGNNALTVNTAANNTAVGFSALVTNVTGTGNVAIGNQAGFSETGSNTLYISNSATTPTTSLIYGDFSGTRILRTNSIFQIGNPAGTGYVFPIARGTVNQVLQTDAIGVLTWVSPSTLTVTETDPQVTSTTTDFVPKWNGSTLVDGVIRDNGTNVGIGGAPSFGNKLDITGNTKTTNFQMTAGANLNYLLQSDAIGNASWAPIPVNTVKPITSTGTTTGIYTISLTQYTIRVFNAISDVRLPDAVTNTGKVYIIIGSNLISSKILSTSGGVIYDDVTNTTITTINANERVMVQSDGTDWIVIGR